MTHSNCYFNSACLNISNLETVLPYLANYREFGYFWPHWANKIFSLAIWQLWLLLWLLLLRVTKATYTLQIPTYVSWWLRPNWELCSKNNTPLQRNGMAAIPNQKPDWGGGTLIDWHYLWMAPVLIILTRKNTVPPEKKIQCNGKIWRFGLGLLSNIKILDFKIIYFTWISFSH